MTVRINFWSGPRNVSTAMMYAWRERPDTTVVDEPLYAHALRVTGREHPGREAVLAGQDNDGERVIDEVILGSYDTPVVFFKQMAKHLVGLDRSFITQCHNVLLIRDPHDMLTSFQNQVPDTTLADTGFTELVEILDATVASGAEPIVVESQRLLEDPSKVLAELCRRLDLPFYESMLSWDAGPKPEDGVWAPHWYAAVHKSTGWGPPRSKDATLLPDLEPVLADCNQLYRQLLPYAIT